MLEYLTFSVTKRLPRPYGEYNDHVLHAFLAYMEDELNRQQARTKRGRLAKPKTYSDAIETGDDLVDRWERDIAAGRVPDLRRKR